MAVDLRRTWSGRQDGKKSSPVRRPNAGDTLATLLAKKVIVITRSGHWLYGILRDVDSRGILLTTVQRIEPKIDANGVPMKDPENMVTLKRALPFEIPVDGIGEIVVRKMFIAWGHVAQILRAKTKDEIEKEEQPLRR